ncbi:MAG: universal stress protein UspA [Bacteroidetes bacterium]|jgi:nucleotide-binding universal stress UspA family protein|nr:universal stress protein UspA [Bacteroidota bacterium]
MEILKILIPTDFSVQAEYAYLMVKKLEEKTPIEIHFIHVLDVPDTVTIDKTGKIQTCGEIDINYVISQKEIADRKLKNLKNIYGQHIQTHLVLGKITDSILKYSEANKFDLIVMGTKGAWGLKEKLSGSEAQIIARKSETPLLSLMCDRSDMTIKNILLVHDFKNPSNDNLILLRKLIKAFGAKVHQLQIVSKQTDLEKENALQLMDKYAAKNNITDYENHLLNDMDVENGVIHFNQMQDMDIVCIGTHGKGGLFHTSATEKLINHLFKPIISFHLKN